MVGDLEDHYRLYSVDPADGQPHALTPATVDVSDVEVAGNWRSRSIFFVSNQKNPYQRHVYRMAETGGTPIALTSMPGTHQPTVSPDGSTVALLSSNDVTPTELYMVDARGGGSEQRVTHSPPPEFDDYAWAAPHYVTFKSRIDDFTLHARILEPPNLDPTRKYPVLFGPVYSNTVRNRWAAAMRRCSSFSRLNGSMSSCRSTFAAHRLRPCLPRKVSDGLCGHDLDDLQSALEYLKTIPYVDTDRAGIWGSSYGGLLTVYMPFKKPGLFKAGVAGAAAVDPHFFGTDDVALTRLPQTDPEGFRRGAASNYAAGLQDHLLFIHGMQDDVVPFKTIVTLMEQLMTLGKDFDMAIAPGATHGWNQREHYAVFLFRKLVQHFDRFLGAPPAAASGATGARRKSEPAASAHQPAAVDHQRLASDIARVVRAEERTGGSDVTRLAEHCQRHLADRGSYQALSGRQAASSRCRCCPVRPRCCAHAVRARWRGWPPSGGPPLSTCCRSTCCARRRR